MNSKVTQEFTSQAVRHLSMDFVPKVRSCLELLTEEEIWWRPNEYSNSIGNLLLHLCGNIRQWLISGVGGEVDVRRRDQEFAQREKISGTELIRNLEETAREAASVIEKLDDRSLLLRHRIQIYDVSNLQAIFHVVEHFAYHTGQILYITKLVKERDLGFYADLEGKKKRF